MLTRIYGLAFATKDELATYEKQLEEARREEILNKIKNEVYDPIHGYKSEKELVENDYSAERKLIKRLYESLTVKKKDK